MSDRTALRPKPWRRWLRIVQIAGTVSLVALLAWTVDWRALLPLATAWRWDLLALSLTIVLLSHLINVMRWRFLVGDARASYGRLLVYYGAGLFGNNFLPTGIGGDSVRVALLSQTVPVARALVSVGVDRALGLLALGAFVLPGLWLGLPPGLALRLSRLDMRIGGGLAAGGLIVLGLGGGWLWQRPLLRRRVADALTRRLGGAPGEQGAGWLQRASGGLGLSLLSNGALVVAYCLALRAVGIGVTPVAALWLLLAGSLSLLLPVAVNGLGLQEGVYVVLLAHYGVAPAVGLSFALVIRMLIVLPSILGGLLSLCKQARAETRAAAPLLTSDQR